MDVRREAVAIRHLSPPVRQINSTAVSPSPPAPLFLFLLEESLVVFEELP